MGIWSGVLLASAAITRSFEVIIGSIHDHRSEFHCAPDAVQRGTITDDGVFASQKLFKFHHGTVGEQCAELHSGNQRRETRRYRDCQLDNGMVFI